MVTYYFGPMSGVIFDVIRGIINVLGLNVPTLSLLRMYLLVAYNPRFMFLFFSGTCRHTSTTYKELANIRDVHATTILSSSTINTKKVKIAVLARELENLECFPKKVNRDIGHRIGHVCNYMSTSCQLDSNPNEQVVNRGLETSFRLVRQLKWNAAFTIAAGVSGQRAC